MKVNDVMTSPAHTCSAGDTLDVAAQTLRKHDCGILPVIDANQRVVGVLTDRDICLTVVDRAGEPLTQIPVELVMSPGPITCEPDDGVDRVEEQMRANQIRRVPVVSQDERLLGVVSIDDLARAAVRPGSDVSREEVTETLAAVAASAR